MKCIINLREIVLLLEYTNDFVAVSFVAHDSSIWITVENHERWFLYF